MRVKARKHARYKGSRRFKSVLLRQRLTCAHCAASRTSSEIFAAITRWSDARLVKRKTRGLYERVNESRDRRPKKAA
jgi:hypothetical protein